MAPRTSRGCWTCRLRRKKCDEHQPSCNACKALGLECHGYAARRPEWMDGGARQEAMSGHVKREIKKYNGLHGRRWHSPSRRGIPMRGQDDDASVLLNVGSSSEVFEQPAAQSTSTPEVDAIVANSSRSLPDSSPKSSIFVCQRDERLDQRPHPPTIAETSGRSDAILSMVYLDYVFPSLFPVYEAPIADGGRAWLVELVGTSPTMRRIALAHGVFYASKVSHSSTDQLLSSDAENASLALNSETVSMLTKALQILIEGSLAAHWHGAARVLLCILLVHHFGLTIAPTAHQEHFSAATSLFIQIFETVQSETMPMEIEECFRVICCHLGPSTKLDMVGNVFVLSAEQAAFRFSTSIILFEGIIRGTLTGQIPQLYHYHQPLLAATPSLIDLSASVGCPNPIAISVGKTVVLQNWKQQRKDAGDFDVMSLAVRANDIRLSLNCHLDNVMNVADHSATSTSTDVLNIAPQRAHVASCSAINITSQLWAHSSLLFLFSVASGYSPTNDDVKRSVSTIINLLSENSTVLRNKRLLWPICMAGCFAQAEQQARIVHLLNNQQTWTTGAIVRKARSALQDLWTNLPGPSEAGNWDFATSFQVHGEPVWLV